MRFASALIAFAVSALPYTYAVYDPAQARVSLTLAQAAYCGKDAYLTHTFSGVVEGFEVTYVIYDPDHDTHGFVGYLPSDRSIYMSVRGTETYKNWWTDLDATKTDYNDDHCLKCEVHTGFYKAEQHII